MSEDDFILQAATNIKEYFKKNYSADDIANSLICNITLASKYIKHNKTQTAC